jgi:hypothetical protein
VRLLKLLLQRLLVLGVGIFTVWLIVFVVFETADRRLPWIVAVGVTYGLAAYIILPQAIRTGLKILQRKLVPSYTVTGDGFPGDPVNIALIGTQAQLRLAFERLGWHEPDRLGLVSSWRMIKAFLLNRPYPRAPFSSLFLFGRRQDIGFQEPIDNSPRRRHHIRFWALSMQRAEGDWGDASFWLNTDRPPDDECVFWIGAGTKDIGLSLIWETLQFTHATDSDTNAERDHIIAELTNGKCVEAVREFRAGEHLPKVRVNHYVTDGDITLASLVTEKIAPA